MLETLEIQIKNRGYEIVSRTLYMSNLKVVRSLIMWVPKPILP